MDNLERRAFVDCRAEASDNGRRIKGYAIRFNSLSENLGGFKELIAPEAVDRTINEGLDVRALVDHDSAKVLGRTRAGTLTLRKDSKGLAIQIEPDDEISYAKDIMRAVARGDVSGMSFGFSVMPGGDHWDEQDGMPLRTVHDMRIAEVTIATFPAYRETDVSVAQRSLHAALIERGSSIDFLLKVHRTRMAR